jgi:hypothetical protein
MQFRAIACLHVGLLFLHFKFKCGLARNYIYLIRIIIAVNKHHIANVGIKYLARNCAEAKNDRGYRVVYNESL